MLTRSIFFKEDLVIIFPIGESPKPNRYKCARATVIASACQVFTPSDACLLSNFHSSFGNVGLRSISDRSSNPIERSSFKNLPDIVVYSSPPDANNEPPVDSMASENSSAL